jgi:hypothetical protein
MAKLTRVEENVVAFSALMVESRPPIKMTTFPWGITWEAARASPSSFTSPSHSQMAPWPAGGSMAPRRVMLTSR